MDGRKDSTKIAEKTILALLLEGRYFIEKTMERLSLDEFKDSSIRDVVRAAFDLCKDNKEVSAARLINHLGNKDEFAILISETAGILETLVDKERALADCIARVKRDDIKDQLDRLQAAIKIAHDSKDDGELKKLLSDYDSLVRSYKT